MASMRSPNAVMALHDFSISGLASSRALVWPEELCNPSRPRYAPYLRCGYRLYII